MMWVGYRGKMSRKILGSEDAARFGPLVSNEGEKVVHSAEGPLCCPILWFLSRLVMKIHNTRRKSMNQTRNVDGIGRQKDQRVEIVAAKKTHSEM
jgi:hypothetical protein